MCLIVLAWRSHPDFPLVLAANRDEFHERAAAPMGWWDDRPALLAGRDLKAGGTWLGLSRTGRLATVTNYREDQPPAGLRSRGDIVTGFTDSEVRPVSFLDAVDGETYAGFSVLASDGSELAYRSNRGDDTHALDAGIYGLSNASLDTPWPKLVRTRGRLETLLGAQQLTLDDLLEIVADRQPAADSEIPDSGLPFELGRALSAPFIVTPGYGTRCSTALLCRADGHIEIVERRFDADGDVTGESRFVFIAEGWAP